MSKKKKKNNGACNNVLSFLAGASAAMLFSAWQKGQDAKGRSATTLQIGPLTNPILPNKKAGKNGDTE